ncbi:MAG: thiamine-phosphate kinase [Bacteroidales bacterium]|nr:thiamine-phosphate kinase [Bacteroidales bacterium]MBN2764633.1 thiamine-phosphate kinase [Bacteroidales bacterium]
MPHSVHPNDDIAALGKFGLIRHLTKDIRLRNKSTESGVGDDAAVLDYGSKKIVVTTDMLTEGIHFNLEYSPLKHLGYKAAVVGFSDVYAMNANPKQLLVSIAVSARFKISMIDLLYEGLLLACDKYNVDLVGGDTSSSITGMTISVTVLGEAENDKITYRNGACMNDLICLSGDLGAAYMGLQVLERERRLYRENPESQPDLTEYNYILERQLKPEARGDIIRTLRETAIQPTSMIDISDGLSSDILHICKESNAGCKIFADKVPIHTATNAAAEEFSIEPLIAALNGGEDYELLFTVPLSDFGKISAQPGISVIGHITETGGKALLVTPNGNTIELKAQGWNAIN